VNDLYAVLALCLYIIIYKLTAEFWNEELRNKSFDMRLIPTLLRQKNDILFLADVSACDQRK
jgi:hypothetical protein